MTDKQMKALDKMVARGGSITGEEMKEIGYSEASAKNPKKVMKALRTELQKVLKKHKIDLDSAVAPIGLGLKADKVVIHGNQEDAFAEVVPDLELRLRASDRALKLLKVAEDTQTPQQVNAEELAAAMQQGDMIRMQEIMFKKAG